MKDRFHRIGPYAAVILAVLSFVPFLTQCGGPAPVAPEPTVWPTMTPIPPTPSPTAPAGFVLATVTPAPTVTATPGARSSSTVSAVSTTASPTAPSPGGALGTMTAPTPMVTMGETGHPMDGTEHSLAWLYVLVAGVMVLCGVVFRWGKR